MDLFASFPVSYTHLDVYKRQELHELLKQANLDSLYGKTPKNDWLAVNKPNVIFCLMESMGQNMLTYDHLPETDLLGNLRKHFEKDFIFRRFISEDIHTIQSFSALFFISPISVSYTHLQWVCHHFSAYPAVLLQCLQ